MPVIRNVVLLWLREDAEDAAVERMINSLLGMQMPGLLNLSCARDAGLREGNADVVLIADLEDEEAYRGYDQDPEHNRIRQETVAPIAARLERAQYRI